MFFLELLAYIIYAALACVVLVVLLSLLQYVFVFHRRRCKKCGKIMEYKGLSEHNGEEFYMFRCNHCGSWEQPSKFEFLRDLQHKSKENT